MNMRPLRSAAARIASASSTVSAIGFSTNTCLPASKRALDDLTMERRRHANVDGLDLGIGDDRVEVDGRLGTDGRGHARRSLRARGRRPSSRARGRRARRSSPACAEPMKPAPTIARVTMSVSRSGSGVRRLDLVVYVLEVAYAIDYGGRAPTENSSPLSAVGSRGAPQTPPPSSRNRSWSGWLPTK